MNLDFDQLLFTYRDPKWLSKLSQIQEAARAATFFEDGSEQDRQLTDIVTTVKQKRNAGLIDFTTRFDGITLAEDQLRVGADELKRAHRDMDSGLLTSVRQAIENVRTYQGDIFIGNKSTHPGIRYSPLDRVGVCVPGASAPLPSTVIMTAVPAQVAGVDQIAVISPPRHEGSIHPVILAVCYELGIEEVYRIGGAHAVAALAYGTDTIEPVHKIVGPGNQWVQMAKRKVYGHVDIDSVAGPSEVLVIANDQANPTWVAADMLSQAEHAPGSALVFTDSEALSHQVLDQLKRQVMLLGRSRETCDCLTTFSGIICFEHMSDAIEQANAIASEHLEIQCGDQTDDVARQIRHAGALFLGAFTPVAVGDYWAGPSHTLPTGRSARFFSALSSNDFIKSTSIIRYDQDMLSYCAADVIRLAMTEGLDAHANSVRIRQQ
jgi:histidinol dehydrogenase